MSEFCCPVCRGKLVRKENSLICDKNHCFDKSKSGYVNLLLSQGKKGHGDDKLMVQARQSFLSKGYYKPLLTQLCSTIQNHAFNGAIILDSGCGEGWYTDNIRSYLLKFGINADFAAVDISKEALKYAGKRCKEIEWAVASAYNLPLSDKSCDIITSFFAPFAKDEFNRVIKDGGIFITAIPLENHLLGLKQAVYEKTYKNCVDDFTIEGWELISKEIIDEKITLQSNEDILNLFMMTPYYYKTSASDQKKLENISSLETEIQFAVLAYKKNHE